MLKTQFLEVSPMIAIALTVLAVVCLVMCLAARFCRSADADIEVEFNHLLDTINKLPGWYVSRETKDLAYIISRTDTSNMSRIEFDAVEQKIFVRIDMLSHKFNENRYSQVTSLFNDLFPSGRPDYIDLRSYVTRYV